MSEHEKTESTPLILEQKETVNIPVYNYTGMTVRDLKDWIWSLPDNSDSWETVGSLFVTKEKQE